MKRRLAMLLALSLTFTMLPAGYASAAETPEAVEMTVEDSTNEEAEVVEETNDDAVVEEATTGETTLVEDTTEGRHRLAAQRLTLSLRILRSPKSQR